jgi:DNA-binding NtrC family response regulator
MPSRILLVDDDEKIRDVLACLLMELGHEVRTAPGPGDATALLRSEKFHLAFIDNHLGSMKGTDLIPELAALDPDLRYVLISGSPDVDIADDAIRKGVCGFLRKPFRVEEVMLCIGQVNWRKQLEQRLMTIQRDEEPR